MTAPRARGTFRLRRSLTIAGLLSVLGGTLGCGSTSKDETDRRGFETPADSFALDAHAFNFQNYTNTDVVNLTPVEMQRLFGDSACESGGNANCVLTPPARQWMAQLNGSMDFGHCYGMAMLSSLFYYGAVDPASFGAMQAYGLGLGENEPLQREIAFWYSKQALAPVPGSFIIDEPTAQLDRLRDSFNEAGERYALGIFKRNGSQGHAIVPYGVGAEDGMVELHVYDNNFPDELRAMVFDTSANSWSYHAASSPEIEAGLYDGDATSGNLVLIPLTNHSDPVTCPFCGEYDATASMGRSLSSTGGGSVLVADGEGRRMGVVDGEFITEIPGATVTRRFGADLWERAPPPIFEIPAGSALNVSVTGDASGETPISAISITGPGYVVAVNNLLQDPGVVDQVTVEGATVSLNTPNRQAAEVAIAVETAGVGWNFNVRPRGSYAGQQVQVSADLDQGKLELVLSGTEENATQAAFDITMSRCEGSAVDVFSSTGISVPSDTAIEVQFMDWEKGDNLGLNVNGSPRELLDCEIPVPGGDHWGDCDQDPVTGCEIQLHSVENCGGCGNRCPLGVPCTELPSSPDRPAGAWTCEVELVQIEASSSQTCLRRGGHGSVLCWGLGDDGRNGDGTEDSSNVPVLVSELPHAVGLSMGEGHVCVFQDDQQMACWGNNASGQLGIGSTESSSLPVRPPIGNVIAIGTGAEHTCAIAEGGDVYCWGAGDRGQLGHGAFDSQLSPNPIGESAEQLALTLFSTCSIRADGTVWCWGDNEDGVLGAGTSDDSKAEPFQVEGISGATDIAAGISFVCALVEDGAVQCWGDNRNGQVRYGGAPIERAPVTLPLGQAAVKLSLGFSHGCALLADGSVSCWGAVPDGEELRSPGSPGPAGNPMPPTRLTGIGGAIDIATGAFHTCVITRTGVLCMGQNDVGQLGNGSDTNLFTTFGHVVGLR